MSLARFELACLGIVALTLVVMARGRRPDELLASYATIALAAWAGEETCIRFYGFYAYTPAWHAFVLDVPLLVPLIWPLVVLSAIDVTRALLPATACSTTRAALTGAIVAFDASLVEVVAVRAGFWSWAEPGHLGVPLVGVLGWGFFACGIALRGAAPRATTIGAALFLTHALVLASWWLFFRWTARGDLGAAGFVPFGALSIAGVVFAVRARAAGRVLDPSVWGPRVLAASLFFVLLVLTAPRSTALWTQVALVAAPYVMVTALRRPGTRSPAAPRAATAPSPRGKGEGAPSPGA